MDKKTFDELRPKADESIRAGFTEGEFLTLNDIPKNHWYAIKPRKFDWLKIQNELGIHRNTRTKKVENPAKPKQKKQVIGKFYFDRIPVYLFDGVTDG